MRKTPRNLSTEPSAPFLPIDFNPRSPALFPVFLQLRRDPAAEPRRISVKHLPSPRSAILLKIVAMETYAANTPRLTRRRQFCTRLRSG